MGAQGVPQGVPQGAPQRAPQMPSIPFADSSAASSSSAQQAGQPFQSAEMLSASEPVIQSLVLVLLEVLLQKVLSCALAD